MSEKYMHLRYSSKRLNTLSDDILFSNYNLKKANSLFLPVLAGVTQKDPSYFIRRSMNDPYAQYLYVFEYVRSGKGYIEYNGVKYTVEKGDLYILNSRTAPYYYPDAEDPYEKIWVNLCGRFVESLMVAYRISEPVLVLRMNAEPYLQRIHTELADYDFENADACNLKIMHILLDLFAGIQHSRTLENSRCRGSNADEIAEYITQNITSDQLNVQTISSIFYISERTLHRLFVQAFGMTPIHYITSKKINYAQYLLSTTGISVEKLSNLLNFSSMEYFRKTFVRYCGCSPLKWRKKNRLADAEDAAPRQGRVKGAP